MRLDKFLSDMSTGSRSEMREAIRRGHVKVNGCVIKKPDTKVSEKDEIRLYDSPLLYTSTEYYMLNKPSGVLSASRDRKAQTVLDLISDKKRKDLFPVGRLDKDTEGLLLITNDGEMAHRLLSPKRHVPKVYYAVVDGRITEETEQHFREGLVIDEEFTALPAKIRVLVYGENKSEAELTIYEGKFHQIKRMFAAEGLTVTYLKRLSMGSLTLDKELKPGGFRTLTKEEIDSLRMDAGIG